MKEIELLQGNFLWKGRETSKPHLIQWNDVVKKVKKKKRQEKNGGLGLGETAKRNLALLANGIEYFQKSNIPLGLLLAVVNMGLA